MQAIMTTAEAAAALGISPSGVAYRVRRGQLAPLLKAPGLRGAYVFSRSTVERLKRSPAPDSEAYATAGGENGEESP